MHVDASRALLRWFAVDKRRLPWRAEGGERPEPYRVWLSEVMLQQTTVAHAAPYFEAFIRRWPTVEALAAAAEGEVMAAWAGLGYYARARNLIACARKVADELGGRFPDTEEGLRKLPGIGRYTAAAIAAIAFGRRAVVVDANVERVVARLFAVETALPAAREEIYRLAGSITPDSGAGDFAQAMMDLGATICTPRAPDCGRCPLQPDCAAFASGTPDAFPAPKARIVKPVRYGTCQWVERNGRVWLVRRPANGLLGGMAALPGGEWSGEPAPQEPDAWLRHVFSHFALELGVVRACEPLGEGWWQPVDRLNEAGLPTLYRRAAALMIEQLPKRRAA